MSTTIDQRVVEMRFDNKHFEANVATTMSTLDKLKAKLNFTDSAKGLQSLSNYINKCDFSGINHAVDTVNVKLSAMNVAATMALTNMMNTAANAGKKMVKALTVDPVSSGFSEYELKMGSLQTIMSSTGESLEVVNKYLQELNEYSDRTIYSFSDMTSNIGKFTNAGVKLEDAVTAIKGVSNVAALAGASANDASRAMYNFSQALSSGAVKLIDWKSIENANMATVGFKEQLIETAVELGTVVKVGNEYKSMTTDANGAVSDLFTSTKGFNEALSSQWMTTDVLVKTLAKYTDENTELGQSAYSAAQDIKTFSQLMDTLKESAQSGWAQSFELIFGNLEEAKDLWTEINEVVGTFLQVSADARNAILQDWKDYGGRTFIFQGLLEAFQALTTTANSMKQAFMEVFPNFTGEGLAILSKRIELVAKGFNELATRNAPKIQKSFKAFFTVLKAVTTVLGGAFSIALKAAVVTLTILSQVMIDITEGIADVILSFSAWIKKSGLLSKAITLVATVVAMLTKGVLTLAKNIISGVTTAVKIINALVQEFLNLKIVQTILTGISNGIEALAGIVVYFVGGIVNAVRQLFTNLANLKNISFESVMSVLSDFGTKIKDIFGNVGETFDGIKDSVEKFGVTVKESFETTGETVEKLQNKFVTFASIVSACLYSIGPAEVFAVGFGIALIYFLRKFTMAVNKILKPVTALSGALTNFGAVLKSIEWSIKASALTSAAIAIAVMAASLVILAKVAEGSNLLEAAGILVALGIAMTLFAKYASSFGNVDKFMGTMLSFAGAIAILVASMKLVETISPERIADTFFVLQGLMLGMGVFAVALARYAPVLAVNSPFLLAFATAMLIVTASLKTISGIDQNVVTTAIVNVFMIAGGLAAVCLAVSTLKLGSAVGILAVGVGLIAFANVLQILVGITPDILQQALDRLKMIGDKVIPYIIGIFVASKAAGKYAAHAGVAMLGVGGSILLMTKTIQTLSNIPQADIEKAIVNLTSLMVAMGLVIMSTKLAGEHAVKAGTMLLQLAGAMVILTAVIAVLAHVDAWGMVKAVSTIVLITRAMSILIQSTEHATKATGTLITLAATLAGLVAAVGVLAMLETKDLVVATASIVLMMNMFAALVKALDFITDAKTYLVKAIAGIGSMVVVVGAIAALVALLDHFEVGASIETVGSISLLLFSMIAAVGIMAAMGPISMAGLAGAKAMLAAMVPVGAVIAALGAIVGLIGALLPDGAVAALERGFSIMGMFARGCAEVVGNALGGLLEGFRGEELKSVGETLSQFMTDIGDFIEGVKAIDERAKDGVGRLCEIMLELGGTSLLTSILTFGNTFKEIEQIDATGALATVDTIAKLGNESGKMQKLLNWLEDNDVNAFKRNMVTFGNSMVAIANTISGYPADTVMSANAISQTLQALQNGVVNNGLFGKDIDLVSYGTELTVFGEHLKMFYDDVSGINAGTLGNVMAGLDALTTSVKNIGTVDTSTLTTFTSVFTNMGEQAVRAFTDTFKNAAPQVSSAVNGLLSTITAAMSGNAPLMQAAGQAIVSNIGLGIESMPERLSTGIAKPLGLALIKAQNYYKSFFMVGENIVRGIVNGMNDEKGAAYNAAKVLARGIVNAMEKELDINSPSKETTRDGGYIIQGMINGMMSKMRELWDTASLMGTTVLDSIHETLDMHSPPTTTTEDGALTVQGMINGIASMFGKLKDTVANGLQENVLAPMNDVEGKAKEAGAGILDGWTDSMMSFLGEYTPEFETMFAPIETLKKEIETVGDNGISNAVTETVSELANAMDSAGVSSSGLTKALGGTSSGAKALSKALDKTTKKKEIDINKTYEATTALEKYMERLYKESEQYKTDTETLEAYRAELAELEKDREEMQKQLEDNTEGRIKLSKEEKEQITKDLEELEDTIYNKQVDISEHLETMCDNAKSEFEGLRDAIKSSMEDALDFSNMDIDPGFDWFKPFELDEEITSDSVLENMKSQYKGVEQYYKNLEKLANKKNMSAGLLEELKNMGISGASYVQAFVEMSSSELKKASKYFEEGGALAGQKLLSGMQDAFVNVETWKSSLTSLLTSGLDQRIVEALAEMGTDSQKYIDAFLTLDEDAIASFNDLYAKQLILPDAAADDMMNSFVNAGNNAAVAFIEAINTAVGTDSETSASMIEGAVALTNGMTTAIETTIDDNGHDIYSEANSVAAKTLNGFEKHLNKRNGKEIGRNICAGLIAGIEAGKSGVINAAVATAIEAYEAAKAALDIESPSKKFFALGKWSDIGMANGFIAFGKLVSDAAVGVGLDAMDGLKNTLQNIGNVIDGKIDCNPTIRPVVDMTSVEESAAIIGSMFNTQQTVSLAGRVQRGVNANIAARNAVISDQTSRGETIINKFEQHNHSPKALSRAEIYRQTKNLFSAAKGTVEGV